MTAEELERGIQAAVEGANNALAEDGCIEPVVILSLKDRPELLVMPIGNAGDIGKVMIQALVKVAKRDGHLLGCCLVSEAWQSQMDPEELDAYDKAGLRPSTDPKRREIVLIAMWLGPSLQQICVAFGIDRSGEKPKVGAELSRTSTFDSWLSDAINPPATA